MTPSQEKAFREWYRIEAQKTPIVSVYDAVNWAFSYVEQKESQCVSRKATPGKFCTKAEMA